MDNQLEYLCINPIHIHNLKNFNIFHSESSANQGWVVKVGPVSGDIYMYGYMTVSQDFVKFARVDLSYQINLLNLIFFKYLFNKLNLFLINKFY